MQDHPEVFSQKRWYNQSLKEVTQDICDLTEQILASLQERTGIKQGEYDIKKGIALCDETCAGAALRVDSR